MGSPFSSPLAAASSSSTAPPPPQPQPLWHSVGPPQMQKVGPTPINLFTTVSSFSYSLPLAASLLQSYNFKVPSRQTLTCSLSFIFRLVPEKQTNSKFSKSDFTA
uniref:Uncharacterized protein MANES_10G129800 n=1 Tax=Rhizophora mucronata TaxID=61149 RepID=A0A2P2KTJ8_RHIMU